MSTAPKRNYPPPRANAKWGTQRSRTSTQRIITQEILQSIPPPLVLLFRLHKITAPRQREIAMLLTQGLRVGQIAAKLEMLDNTIEDYIEKICDTLDVDSHAKVVETLRAPQRKNVEKFELLNSTL